MKKFGIDISRWQKGFDIAKAKAAGVEFVILKIGGGDDGLYKDSCFNDFYNQCKKIGMPVGCYYFGHALTMDQAKKEAEHFHSLISGKQFEYPVFYDVEADMLRAGKENLTEICKYVLSYLEDLGWWVGIYGSVDNLQASLDDKQLKKYSHWGAAWSATKPSFKSGSELQMWQFGGETNKIRSTKINGVVVDQNYCFVDYPSKIKANHKNGFFDATTSNSKPTPAPKPSMKVGASVKIKSGAKDLNYNKKFASFVYKTTYKIIKINGDKVVFGTKGVAIGVVTKNDIVLV